MAMIFALGTLPAVPARLDPRPTLRRALALNRPLALFGLAMLVLLGGTLAGLIADPRVITGAPVWLKPAKFALSMTIYSFTFLWLLRFVQGRPRLVRLASWATMLMLVVEMIVIVGQAARGATSHYNTATSLDSFLWSLMGIGIMVVWLMNALAAGLLLRQRLPDAAFAWSLRLALLLSLVGMAVAMPMVSGAAHSVGVPDGGPGLPVVGWSTIGGDLRPAHFLGLHAMQALPLAGWLIARRGRRLGGGHRRALVWVVGLTYLGAILLLTWQGLRAQPLLAPDGLTLAALAGLIAGSALAGGAIVLHARRRAAGSTRAAATLPAA